MDIRCPSHTLLFFFECLMSNRGVSLYVRFIDILYLSTDCRVERQTKTPNLESWI
jgi:hypothetical protein